MSHSAEMACRIDEHRVKECPQAPSPRCLGSTCQPGIWLRLRLRRCALGIAFLIALSPVAAGLAAYKARRGAYPVASRMAWGIDIPRKADVDRFSMKDEPFLYFVPQEGRSPSPLRTPAASRARSRSA